MASQLGEIVETDAMKIIFKPQPSALKLIACLTLVFLSFLSMDNLVFYLFYYLWIPLSPMFSYQPFVMADKPWYFSQQGAHLTAAIWSGVIYITLSIRKKSEKN